LWNGTLDLVFVNLSPLQVLIAILFRPSFASFDFPVLRPSEEVSNASSLAAAAVFGGHVKGRAFAQKA
jgi:hypothetical protein